MNKKKSNLIVYLLPVIFCALPSSSMALDREQLGEECYSYFHEPEKADPELATKCKEKLASVPNIVITPTKTASDRQLVPAAVATVESKEIERSPKDSLAELLRDIPGVEVSDSGQPGLKRIRIRGEESRRVAIQIDGQEFIDEREVGTPLLIAPEMIERIEILRGPGAVLHGSRAIGGVINIITKKGGYHPIQASYSTSYDTGTKGVQGFASVFGKHGNTDYRLAGTRADNDDRDSAHGEIENTDFDNGSVSAYLGHVFRKNKISGIYENFQASSSVYVEPEVANTPPFVDFRIQAPRRDREKLALFFEGEKIDSAWEKLHLDGYYQISERQFDTFSKTVAPSSSNTIDTSILTSSELETWGGNAQFDWQLPANNYLISGLKLKDDSLTQDRIRSVSPTNISQAIFDQASQSVIEGYLQNEWSVNQEWSFIAGARAFFIKTELERTSRQGLEPIDKSDDNAIGSASLRYSGLENTTLWASFSQGYVNPSLINLATGAYAGPNFVNPDPNLDPERANAYELGIKYDSGKFGGEVSGFITPAKNYINHVPCSILSNVNCLQPTGARDRIYANIERAETYGVEAEARFSVFELEPYAELSWIRRKYETPSSDTYDTGIPAVSGRVGLSAEKYLANTILSWFDLYLRMASSSKEFVSADEIDKRSGWGSLNASLGLKLEGSHTVSFIVDLRNLADKDYTVATENIPAVGRSAVFKFSVDL